MNRRVLLLAAQAFTLGLTMAWILIPASAIFLTAYGSELLPVTYIGAAFAGAAASAALSAALRRRPISVIAARVLGVFAIGLLAAWAALLVSGAEWVSFALLVLIPIVVPVGFVFVVGQAGLLLDVRSLKARYGRVVAGFALGFTVGGLAGPTLLTVLGQTEQLLAMAALAATAFLGLVVLTRRLHPVELAELEPVAAGDTPVTVGALARHRYVVLIIAFQMLSAVESQWLDFLVFERAAGRYADSSDLAAFVSRFSAIAYGTDILFLLVLSGLLLRRFGLRYGLTANAVGVLIVVGAIIVASSFVGSTATIVFILIVTARVVDLALADGSSRTSLSAAYQALPTRLRGLAQATVEGLAVPVAIGVAGVVLLVLQATGGIDGLALPLLTAAVVIAWLVCAFLLYREYRVNLLANLRGRTLDPADISVDDESLFVIDRLVESDDERDVRLALNILTIAQHPDLPVRLQRLAADDRVGIRCDALERLVELAPQMAAVAARDGLDDSSPAVRAASIRVLGQARDPSDIARIAPLADDDDPDIVVAVAYALLRERDDTPRRAVVDAIARRARSQRSGERALAARMLGEYEPGAALDRRVLRELLADPDLEVRRAALQAFHWPDDADDLPLVLHSLSERPTASAAGDALVRIGEPALLVIDADLGGEQLDHRAHEHLVRVVRDIGGPAAIAVLRRHVQHPSREVGLSVMRALAMLGPGLDDLELDRIESDVVREDLEHATHVLRALVTLDAEAAAGVLGWALRDELTLLRNRLLAALSLRHGTEGLNQVVFQLAQRDSGSHALALEWLDVTLTGTDRAVVTILEPGRSDRDRLTALGRWFPLAPTDAHAVLADLIQDTDGRWRRPWITACAIYAAAEQPDADLVQLVDLVPLAHPDAEGIVQDTIAEIRRRAPA